MTQEEKKEWNDLYQYVRHNIMDYDDNQSLNKSMVLRLKGMQTGKYIANKKQSNKANYSFKVILLTFKACVQEIEEAKCKVTFKDDMHKFNYIMRIVDNRINDIYTKLKRKEKSDAEVDKIDQSEFGHYQNNYKPLVNKRINPKLQGLL